MPSVKYDDTPSTILCGFGLARNSEAMASELLKRKALPKQWGVAMSHPAWRLGRDRRPVNWQKQPRNRCDSPDEEAQKSGCRDVIL